MTIDVRSLLSLGHEIMHIRTSRGITQSQLARRIGKAQSYISKIETQARTLDVHDFVAMVVACNAHVEINFGEFEIVVGVCGQTTTDYVEVVAA